MNILCHITLLCLVVTAVAPRALAVDADVDFFEKSVRPLLVKHCYECHSEKAEEVKGGLLLDSRDGWQRGGDSGPVIVPGKPEESVLLTAIGYDDPELQMPPEKRLADAEIAVLRRWIERGAVDPRDGKKTVQPRRGKVDMAAGREFWAFIPPRDPPAPQVKNADWPASTWRIACAAEPSFETDVLPILRANCFRCHGEKTQKAELSFTNQARLLKGGESGEVVVPGKPDESLLYELLRDGDMPPEEVKRRPTKAQIETIRAWIAAGAKFAGGQVEADRLTQHNVNPIMLLRCTVCHGGRRREAKLDLRTRASMLAGGKSGPAIVPGRPQDSLLLKRIHAGEMPPRRKLVEVSIKVIQPGEIETVTRWIAQGAVEVHDPPGLAAGKADPLVSDKDRKFWAFQPPGKPAVPKLKDAARVRNPIDNFILRRLQDKGLSLSPEADRLTLLRRAHVDLIGLPPTPEEIKAHLADSDPRAYEKMIDRLLASPHYGERWGR